MCEEKSTNILHMEISRTHMNWSVGMATLVVELVLRMVLPANTFGTLLLVLMKGTLVTLVQRAPVFPGALMETRFPRLWNRTISVSQA